MRLLTKIGIALGALIWPLAASAAGFPERAVTLVVPQSPGSSSDILGRYVAEQLSKLWGQPVVIDNRPGGDTMIGTAKIATSKADGYSLLVHSASLGPSLAVAQSVPFNAMTDLLPVVVLATGDMILLTGTRVPLPTLADVVAKSKSQKLFTAMTGGLGELTAHLFMKDAKVTMEPVKYKSPPDALIDLGGGRVDFFVTSVTTYLASGVVGRATPVAVASKTRAVELPNVPTAAEAGFPNVIVEPWWAIFAPAGTPADIVAKINSDVNAVLAKPEAVAFLKNSNSRPAKMSIQEATKFVRDDIKLSGELLKDVK